MTYKVLLRENATGEERWYQDDPGWAAEDGVSEFLWTEGNWACDCNRADFFARAAPGADPDLDLERPCSRDAYSALRAELADGTTVELDGP